MIVIEYKKYALQKEKQEEKIEIKCRKCVCFYLDRFAFNPSPIYTEQKEKIIKFRTQVIVKIDNR